MKANKQLTNKQIVTKYLPRHRVRNIRNAKIISSDWGYHFVEFDYNKLLDDTMVKLGLESADNTFVSFEVFTTKKQALEFIKQVNTF